MKKKMWLTAVIIMTIVIYLQFIAEKEPTEPPEILTFEGLTYVNSHDKHHIVRNETYIIKNPPKKLVDLKKTIEEFNEEYPVLPSESNEDEIVRRFLRLSNYTTMKWANSRRAWAEDHWPVDCIASVYWDSVEDTSEYEMVTYSYMKRWKNGTVYRELEWIKPD